jgi:hypothetical protein
MIIKHTVIPLNISRARDREEEDKLMQVIYDV